MNEEFRPPTLEERLSQVIKVLGSTLDVLTQICEQLKKNYEQRNRSEGNKKDEPGSGSGVVKE